MHRPAASEGGGGEVGRKGGGGGVTPEIVYKKWIVYKKTQPERQQQYKNSFNKIRHERQQSLSYWEGETISYSKIIIDGAGGVYRHAHRVPSEPAAGRDTPVPRL